MSKKNNNIHPFPKQVASQSQPKDPIADIKNKKAAKFVADKLEGPIADIKIIAKKVKTHGMINGSPEIIKLQKRFFKVVDKIITSFESVIDGIKLMEFEYSDTTLELHKGYVNGFQGIVSQVEEKLNEISQGQGEMRNMIDTTSNELLRLEHTNKALFLCLCETNFFSQHAKKVTEYSDVDLAQVREDERDSYIKTANRIHNDVMGIESTRGPMNELVLSHQGVDIQLYNIGGNNAVN